MIRYAIIDDEPIAHGIIEGFAESIQGLEKVGNCYNAFEAIELLQIQEVDVLFLDINMPKLSGFQFLKSLSNPPKAIITSAYKEFALEGFEFDVVDYLLKPFSFERFVRAVNKIFFSKPELKSAIDDTSTYLFIKSDKKVHRVVMVDILYIEASGNYSKLILEDEIIITLKKISDFATMLPSNFVRTHKSFIVAKNKIKAIEGNMIHLKKHKVPIGMTYKSVIKSIYEN